MTDETILVYTILSISTGATILAIYLLCRRDILAEQTPAGRLIVIGRCVALVLFMVLAINLSWSSFILGLLAIGWMFKKVYRRHLQSHPRVDFAKLDRTL